MSFAGRKYPITTAVAILLIVLGGLLVLLCHLLGILYQWWSISALVLYVAVAFAGFVVVRVAEDSSGKPSFWSRAYSAAFRGLNWIVPWHRLPHYLGSLNLLAFRSDLREKNLYDTSAGLTRPVQWQSEYRSQRTADGTFNDLEQPLMGSQGTRFGRNTPLERIRVDGDADLLKPSPREVSRRLMTRDQFVPATSLNLLAAAWIQFQNHDWFNHRRMEGTYIEIPLRPDDAWNANPQVPMKVRRTEPDPTRAAGVLGQVPTFINNETHWWDASQLYGSNQQIQNTVRAGTDGKLKLDNGRLLPEPDPIAPGIDLTGFNDNYWIGLSLLHTLFTQEHNAICDRLRREYPSWSDEQLFQTARLINAALIAKIHTVEWTPAILAHPALEFSMNGNWTGLLGDRYRQAFGRLSDSEVISGIMGSPTHHHAAPYYLTEEFVSVYRLHPLIPDDLAFRRVRDHSLIEEAKFAAIQGKHTRQFMNKYFPGGSETLADLFYSFGMMHPGAVTLHNFPRALQEFTRINGERLDLATIDILRDRERGVPRYNEFRKMLRKQPIKSFRQLTDNPRWAQEIEEVYEGEIDRVDLMVGLYAEPLPRGFGFSDTAFRVFILMASRRLKSDRFFTTDYTPAVYTSVGMEWIDQNNMRTVLQRHLPELTPAIQRSANAFAPWSRVK